MGRPLRIEFPGACYHVINRGNYRGWILARGGLPVFARTLAEAAERFQWLLHAYVILDSHFHLGLQLTEPNLSEGMKWLQGTWIRRTNAFRGLTGRPFQGRYKAILVEPGEHFTNVCNYIHLNPVRAGIVGPGLASEYSWSSLPVFGQPARPDWLCAATVLQGAGGLPDSPAGWRQYVAHLQFLVGDEKGQRELVASKLSRGWCIGSDEFHASMHAKAIAERLDLAVKSFGGLEPDDLKRERMHAWEMKLQALARGAGIDLRDLSPVKSHPDKAALAAAMKLATSVSNGWLAERLSMGKPNSAGKFARRWLLDPTRESATRALLSRILT